VAHGDLDEAQEHQKVALRTVEHVDYPPETGYGSLPAFLIVYTEEVHAGAGEHITRHDPARVLREVTAKRAILEDHRIKPTTWREPDDEAFGCERCHFDRDEGVYGFGYCPTLKALATVYSDHESYREEWAA
jgi:hypothetical protein